MMKRLALYAVIIKDLKDSGVVFNRDPHTLSGAQSAELYEWSQAIRYKPSKSASLSPGRQFYVFLSKLEASES